MIDLFIEFVALVAHGNPLEPRTEATLTGCLIVNTAGMGICSSASTIILFRITNGSGLVNLFVGEANFFGCR